MSEFNQLIIRQWGPKGIRPRVHITLKGSQTFFNIFFPQSLEQRRFCPSTKSGKQHKNTKEQFSTLLCGFGDRLASFRGSENLGLANVLKRCRASPLMNQQTALCLSSNPRSLGVWSYPCQLSRAHSSLFMY